MPEQLVLLLCTNLLSECVDSSTAVGQYISGGELTLLPHVSSLYLSLGGGVHFRADILELRFHTEVVTFEIMVECEAVAYGKPLLQFKSVKVFIMELVN